MARRVPDMAGTQQLSLFGVSFVAHARYLGY